MFSFLRKVKSILLFPFNFLIVEKKTDDRELKKLLYSNIELSQRLLYYQYKTLSLSEFLNSGFRIHSQFEEDGLLLFIFSKIGFTNRIGIEICCGPAYECMLTNLILYHSFNALLFDGSDYNITKAKEFFNNHPNSILNRPVLAKEWLTKENINELILKYGFNGDIDILSMDIDGVDYYLMKEINIVSPRIIICETNNVVPSDLSITVPYDPAFAKPFNDQYSDYRSVSILGMVKLLNEKNYRLIGNHRFGFNLIFMRNDVGVDIFPEISHKQCFENIYTKSRQKDWEIVKHQNWISI